MADWIWNCESEPGLLAAQVLEVTESLCWIRKVLIEVRGGNIIRGDRTVYWRPTPYFSDSAVIRGSEFDLSALVLLMEELSGIRD